MQPHILAISSAMPPYRLYQEDAINKIIDVLSIEEPKAKELRLLYANSGIHQRHVVLHDFLESIGDRNFWGADYPKVVPGVTKRNAVYKEEAPKLSYASASQAIQNWKGDPKDITHLIFISCTGLVAPGIEFDLLEKLQLQRSVNRVGINFMGCFGAFKGLSVAAAFARENPRHRILVVCTELCSLHFQAGLDSDNLTANSLFADGSAAVIIGTTPQRHEKPLWEIVSSECYAVENSRNKMGWEISDHGFVMKLSYQVPVLLARNVRAFIEKILGSNAGISECDWAIHPGGKSILQAIEKTLNLDPSQTQASWETLANHGNMSSVTFLCVLERLFQLNTPKKWSIGIAFGPGLSLEGTLLKKCS